MLTTMTICRLVIPRGAAPGSASAVDAAVAAATNHQHGDNQDKRDRQLQFAPDIGDEGAGDVLDDPDGETAEYRAAGARQPAEHGAGEAVQEDAEHHVRLEEDNRRDQHASDRADRGGHAPAERRHPADANADEAGGIRVGGGGTHRETQAGAAEEQVQQAEQPERHADHAGLVRVGEAVADQRLVAERGREGLDRVIPEIAGGAVQDAEERDERDEAAEHRGVVDRPEQDPLDQDAADKRQNDRGGKGDPVGLAPIHQLPGDKGREHRHLALSEIEMVDRLVDHDDRQRHAGIDAAGRQPRHDLLQQQFHAYRSASFRGAAKPRARKPCTQTVPTTHRRSHRFWLRSVFMDPGPGPAGRPAMTILGTAALATANTRDRRGGRPHRRR